MTPKPLTYCALVLALTFGSVLPGVAADVPESLRAHAALKVLDHADYTRWRSIQGVTLSRNGQWAAYALVGADRDGELVVRRLADGHEWRAERGTAPQFSADGRHLAFALQPRQAEVDAAKLAKKKPEEFPKPGMAWMDLSTGAVLALDRVKRFAFAPEGGTQLAALLEPTKPAKPSDDASSKADDQEAPTEPVKPAKKKEAGSELIVIDTASGAQQAMADVSEFVWARQGHTLAYAVSTLPASEREGVYLLRGATQQSLLSAAGHYKQLSFDDAGTQLAFVGQRAPLKGDAPSSTPAVFKLYLHQSADAQAHALLDGATPGLTEGWSVSEHAKLDFSRDGKRLFFGTAPTPKAADKLAPEALKVDLWHWKDAQLQSVQRVNADKERQRSYRAVWHIAQQRWVQLATLQVPEVQINDNADVALGHSNLPYRQLQSWDAGYVDSYAIDLHTGQQRLLARKLREPARLSPEGRYATAFERSSKSWLAWRTQDASRINLTGGLKARFDNQEQDTPDLPPAYGLAGWTPGDAAVVLYDRFDLWSVQPETQQAHKLSQGAGRQARLQLRNVVLDTEQPETKPLPAQLLLAATHQSHASTGFYRLALTGGEPTALLHTHKLLGSVIKAKDADTLLYTQQSFVEFPNLWATDLSWQAPQQISDANPQQAEYQWGTQALINITTAEGRREQAVLTKPANFDPKKKYPLMVYIYEKMSDNLHRYSQPAPSQNITISRYASQGYLVLRPDITFSTGTPGKSSYNTVIPAVQQLISQGIVDAKRVGIQGHSWGAYQINYLITRTPMFAAAEAGASMANMVSGYGGIRWGTGLSRAFQYEQGQSRMATTPWQRPDLYVENSPIFQVHKVQTPYLTIHNDDDDAVPYYQAIEFFTALRRLGKEAYWFNFNGAKHGLRDIDARKYFALHMDEFFDHYLLGKPRPQWMDEPVPYLERGKRAVNPLYQAPKP